MAQLSPMMSQIHQRILPLSSRAQSCCWARDRSESVSETTPPPRDRWPCSLESKWRTPIATDSVSRDRRRCGRVDVAVADSMDCVCCFDEDPILMAGFTMTGFAFCRLPSIFVDLLLLLLLLMRASTAPFGRDSDRSNPKKSIVSDRKDRIMFCLFRCVSLWFNLIYVFCFFVELRDDIRSCDLGCSGCCSLGR